MNMIVLKCRQTDGYFMDHNQKIGLLKEIIKQDAWMMQVLTHVCKINKPDTWIGAGFVRNKVWDHLHGFEKKTEYDDVDVIYFDPENIDKQQEQALEQQLKLSDASVNWSVKNQARMHLKHGHQPYQNCNEAISFWVETATCIAARLNQNGQLAFIFPVGIDDLFELKVRKNPRSTIDHAGFLARVEHKRWLDKWPKLRLVDILVKSQHEVTLK